MNSGQCSNDLSGLVDLYRIEVSRHLGGERRAEMGQFLTPLSVARFMASMLTLDRPSLRVLDAGAGLGTLTAAVAQEAVDREDDNPREIHAVAYEVDDALEPLLRSVLELCREACGREGVRFRGEVLGEDFVRAGVAALAGEMFAPVPESFDCAILNPPYRRLNKDSAERRALREVGIDVGNLYAAFLALAVELLKP